MEDREIRLVVIALMRSVTHRRIAVEAMAPADPAIAVVEALRRELQRRLDAAVAALPEADREIILLRHGEQLSNQETAAALGVAEAAASMRYLRAVRRLRTALLPGGGSDS